MQGVAVLASVPGCCLVAVLEAAFQQEAASLGVCML